MNTLHDQWMSYFSEAMPKMATPIQVIETRRAFYAGAQSMLALQNLAMDATSNEEALVLMLTGWYQELDQFIADLGAGKV